MKLFGAIKRYLVIVAMLYVATALADTWYDESTGYTWTYRIVGDAAEIYAHWGPAVQPKPVGNLTIPSVLGDKSVVSIGNYAFSSCRDLSGVDIPNTVTNVAYNAFYDCISLTNQNGLVIVKDIVFGYYGEDEHVAIPNGVRAIGYSAFHNDAVKSISIPSSLVYIDKGGVSLSGVDSIYIDDLTAWCNLEVYGMVAESYVLYLNGLLVKNLEIPDGVTAIRDWNFAGCTSIETLHIPNSVTIIDSCPFAGCWNLVQISVDDCNNRYEVRNGVLCDRNSSSAVICPAGKQGVVHIPEGIERIYYSAFANCREISEVVIPSTIRYIDNGAFSCCTSITNIFIPKDVIRVGNNAFANCTALGNVSLPITLKDRLDSSVFWGCSKELTIDYYGEYHAVTFDSDGGTPANVTCSILDWESNGERIGDLPVVSKEGYALEGWYDDKGEKVTPEYIVTSNIALVANWERAKCSVTFYDRCSNTIFEERVVAYGDCIGSLPDLSNEGHDGCVFSGWTCWDIDGFVTAEYAVKSSLIVYSYWEFVGYTISFDLNGADTFDEIPSIVQTDDIAVDDLPVPFCDNKIFLGWYEEPIGGKRIQRNLPAEKSRTLYAHWANEATVNDVMWRYVVNGGEAEIYSCSTDDESIVIPSELDGLLVSAIGENVFRGNVSLSSITIPGSVTNIGPYAFYGCTNLQEVCFNEGLVSISSGAFAYCTRLKSIEMPSTLKELGQREAKVSKAAMESIFITVIYAHILL